MTNQLRPYQSDSSDEIYEAWKKHQSTLLVMATGLGKTVVFADVIKRMRPGRALVLANREELIFQACDKIQRWTGLDCAIEMGDMVASANLFNAADVVVSTVQTQIAGKNRKRMTRFNPDDFALLVVDEAHFSVSNSFRQVINHYKQNHRLKILGVTATPLRHDEQALGQIYESTAANYGILYGIQNGWLCDITQQYVSVAGLDYSHIKTLAGDLNPGELSRVLEQQENVIGFCQPSLEVMFALTPKTLGSIPVPDWGAYLRSLGRPPRRSIMFTASVHQAELCAEIFNRVMPGMAEYVCGETPKDKRRDLFKRFETDGDPLRIMMNCGVMTHGYDNPLVECIFMARPTKSHSLVEQMIGRGTRALPGVVDGEDKDTPEKRMTAIKASAKPFVRIVDFVGICGKHKIVTTLDVLGGRVSSEAVAKARKQAVEEGKPMRVTKLLDQAEVALMTEKQAKLEKLRMADAARRNHLVARVDYSTQDINPFDLLDVTPASPFSRNFGRPPTEKMIKFLADNGIDSAKHRLTFTDAGKMIGKIKELQASAPPTDFQRRRLLGLGWNKNELMNMTRAKATKALDAAAQNGWKRPLFTT